MNRLVTCLVLVWLAMLVTGCAVGRGPAGEVVLGWDAGQLTDTANAAGAQVATAAAEWLGVPLELALGIGAVVGTGGVGGVLVTIRKILEANRRAAEARAEAARLEGEKVGWDLREAAAFVQQPLAQVVYEGRVPIAEPGGVIDDRGEIESSRGRGFDFNQNGGVA